RRPSELRRGPDRRFHRGMTGVALGFRVHTGWAAAVAIAGTEATPQVVLRERVEMLGTGDGETPFVYHAAKDLAPQPADASVKNAVCRAHARARAAVGSIIGGLRARGYDVVGSAVVVSNSAVPETLEAILRSHALIHAAEGELFRRAIIEASEACDVPVTS